MRSIIAFWLASLQAVSVSSSGNHDKIRVFADPFPLTAENENLFLCRKGVVDMASGSSSWPFYEIDIDGSECMDYEELMALDGRGDFLDCVAHVTNLTTHTLADLGISGFITDGSLLGWSRHNKGMVPWDVDGDTAMLKRECDSSFNMFGSEHKNMIGLLKDRLGADYFVGARLAGVGSIIPEDSFTGCETNELMVRGTFKGKVCHTDIWILASDDGTQESGCRCKSSVPEPRVCRKTTQCFPEADLVPSQWSTQLDGDVQVPADPLAALATMYSDTRFMNMKYIPGNYKFGNDWILVVGTALQGDESQAKFMGWKHAVRSAPQSPLVYPVVALFGVVVALALCYIKSKRRSDGHATAVAQEATE